MLVSSNGMGGVCRPKSHWGIHLWGFIHTISIIDFPEQNIIDYHINTINNLKGVYNIFPCPVCKSLYKTYLDKLELIDLREPMVLFHWSVDLHNAVNAKLGKPLWSYERAVREWCTKVYKSS